MGVEVEVEGYAPLFESRKAKGRVLYRAFATSIFGAICVVWAYRVTQTPWKEQDGWMIRFGWMALFGAEIWFTFYWILTQALRWNPIYRSTFKDRLFERYKNDLPGVDAFVCTADPTLEPPIMVINTVLSVMAYDYPPEKLAIYLSDDGGSELTFYAMLEASRFSKYWLPYCRKYNIEPRSPDAHFSSVPESVNPTQARDLATVQRLYKEMQNRIETAIGLGRISADVRAEHKGFSKWDSYTSRNDHDTILEILIDRRDPEAKDVEGCSLPTLVYLSREKRPQHFHNYKAGALNSLIRASSIISNGHIVMNVDCDMNSNDSQSIWDVLCFFMDEKQSQQIAYVQFPQKFANLSKNDLYGGLLRSAMEVEFHGLDGYGGPIYIGTGCFHRRDILYGKKFSKDCRLEWLKQSEKNIEGSVQELEEKAKALASCTYDKQHPEWGKEVGIQYGFICEDTVSGLAILCRGWKSVFFNPKREGFLGAAPTTLVQALVQQKRWGEALLQIAFSERCPLTYGCGKISFGLQLGVCHYLLWAMNCLATVCYSTIPSLYLLRGTRLFPQMSSVWFLPFAYIIISRYTYSLGEFLCTKGTVLSWWNDQRMWLYKRITPYFFAFLDFALTLTGLSNLNFVITCKSVDDEESKRYETEMMEFSGHCPMFTFLAMLALLNLFSFVAVVKRMVMNGGNTVTVDSMGLQIILCGALVLINLPLYGALFLRKDKGKMPRSQTMKSVGYALLVSTCFSLL
ncbi:hypothetical protein Ancab_024935 [Ancistrocladus abbreviatus]